LVLAAGCGGGGGRPAASRDERALAVELITVLGARPEVRCRFGVCQARLGASDIPVWLQAAGDTLRWRIPGWLVRVDEVEAELTAEATALALPGPVECGPPLVVLAGDAALWCAVGDDHAARVGIDAAGAAEIELVIGADAIAARRHGAVGAELETASRALDLDETDPLAAAAAEDDDPAPGPVVDAALAPPP
jgi:hypothetical protein